MAKATNKKAASKPTPKNSPQPSPKKAVTVANLKKASVSRPIPKKSAEPDNMLEELFVDSLKDIYWAEKALTKALVKMSKSATSEDLRSAFNDHLTQTEEQVQRLEQVFESIGKKAQAKKCEAMSGLIKEAEEMISSTKKGTETRDVALIMAAQKVEHYEIATYGSLCTLAAQMGLSDAKELLGQTLQEEKDTDGLLTEIAESHINQEAENESNNTKSGNNKNEEVEEE